MESNMGGLGLLLFSVALVAVVCIVMTKMAARGQLDRNSSAGIRTRHTQVSDRAWKAGHAAALPIVNKIGWVAVATFVCAIAVQMAFGGSWGVLVGLAGILGEVIVLLFASRAANNAAQTAI